MTDVLAIQNTKNEGISTLGKLFEEDGFGITTVLAKKEKIPPIAPRVIVILGAPESANDDLSYIKDELALIQNAVKNETPVLGICLGSQLIAKAFGAKVYQGKKKEIGFYSDIEFDNTSKSRLFKDIKSPATVFHWHGDTFDLPDNAIRLAHSKDYQNQALKVGSAVGIQFHLEVDESTIKLWLDRSRDDPNSAPYIKYEEMIREITQNISTIQNNMQIFYKNFKSEFRL